MEIKKTTARMLKRFSNWLHQQRHFVFPWYSQDAEKPQAPERSLVKLPPKIRKKLVAAIDNLPDNTTEIDAIVSKVEESFNYWRNNRDYVNNCLVILSSPVTAVSRILSAALEEWTQEQSVKLRLLPLDKRPTEIATIKSKLEHYLQPNPPQPNQSEVQPAELIVIPNLSWYFLRSLEGLAAIEYLQSLLSDGSQDRFWIIGVNHISWEYLNCLYHLEAACQAVLSLPALSAEQLSTWLAPIVEELDITFAKPRLEKKVLDGDGNKDNQTYYFNRLASISEGVSIVATQSFLESIGYQEIAESESENGSKSNILVAETPQLPDLPNLEPADQYLLYSLLLHDDLTLSALAESLADEEQTVQARVQMLRRQGVIQQQNKILRINPLYYFQIQQYLESNNFIVNRR